MGNQGSNRLPTNNRHVAVEVPSIYVSGYHELETARLAGFWLLSVISFTDTQTGAYAVYVSL